LRHGWLITGTKFAYEKQPYPFLRRRRALHAIASIKQWKKEYDMFEATFKIATLIVSDGQGRHAFKVYQQGAPFTRSAFSSLVATTFQDEVYQNLKAGDTLIIVMRTDPTWREIERILRFREDAQFEGDVLEAPTADLVPTITRMSEQFLQGVLPGDVFTIILRVQRL